MQNKSVQLHIFKYFFFYITSKIVLNIKEKEYKNPKCLLLNSVQKRSCYTKVKIKLKTELKDYNSLGGN